jgi:hypothetical protein
MMRGAEQLFKDCVNYPKKVINACELITETLLEILHFISNTVRGQRYLLAYQLSKTTGYWPQAEFFYSLSLWPAKMRAEYQPRSSLYGVTYAWQNRLDAVVVCDISGIVQGDIEVCPHQDPLAF